MEGSTGGSLTITTTSTASGQPKSRGRHRSVQAQVAILRSTLELLQQHSLREVTVDAIALQAGVSKATIYKWWPSKCMVALDAFLATMTEHVTIPDTGSALNDFTIQLRAVLDFYNSDTGHLFTQFLAEGQSNERFLSLFRQRFLQARRDAARVMWQRAVDRGEIRRDVDSEIVLDLIYGPMVFRLLARHASTGHEASDVMVEVVLRGLAPDGCR